jgi:hypothetical protein
LVHAPAKTFLWFLTSVWGQKPIEAPQHQPA